MTRERFDKRIAEALHKMTDRAAYEMQDENWQRIRKGIEEMEQSSGSGRRSHWNRKVGIGVSAAVLVLVLSISTRTGQAALEKIRQYFEPEKIVEYEVEGSREDVDSRLQQGEIGYVVYYDQDRYKVVEDGKTDRIVIRDPAEGMPEVYMEISQDADKLPEELAVKLEAELRKDFSRVEAPINVSEPLEAVFIHAINGGTKADDPIVDYYLISNKKGGTFIIKMKYFLEAAEGHGSRFRSMLRDFTILE